MAAYVTESIEKTSSHPQPGISDVPPHANATIARVGDGKH